LLVKWLIRIVSTVAVGCLVVTVLAVAPRPKAVPAPTVVGLAVAKAVAPGDLPDPQWAAPTWFAHASDLGAVAQMDGHGPSTGPSVRSRSAFVFDVDRGEVLFERNADNVRPVASITKLVTALTLVASEPNLEDGFCVGAAQYPSRSGARSRLSTGDCLTGWDALGAALVASDNRAAYGLAAVAGMDIDEFVTRMGEVSAELGMTSSTWSDPSGLEDENLSTARDIARATLAVAVHPLLSTVASAPFWDLHRSNTEAPRRLFSTDRLIGREDLLVWAAKTGYTDTARYCFTTLVETRDGRRLVITLLGADGKLTRWADVARILDWADRAEQG
jgi:D-alanyl-D-alanine endopeptidase (penicillin-binding protein 7)